MSHPQGDSEEGPTREERAGRLMDDLAAIEDRLDPGPAKRGQLVADVITLAVVTVLWVVVDGIIRYPLLLATLLVAARGLNRLLPVLAQRSLRRDRDRLLAELRGPDPGERGLAAHMVGTTVASGGEVPSSFCEALKTVGAELSEEAVGAVRGATGRGHGGRDVSEALSEGNVVRLTSGDAPRVVRVMSEAFHDYPVMRFVLGAPGDDYGRRLERLVGFFVAARALRNEPLLGVVGEGDLAAAAIVSFPDGAESPPALTELREEVWADLGADARARYDACGEAWRPLGVTVPHIHLNMIGVRSAYRGRGYGRILLDRVHRMSVETPGSQGVTLTTEDPRNVDLYRRMGYEVVGHARVAEGLESWGFFRPD